MDRWAWDQLDPWLEIRGELPIGAMQSPPITTMAIVITATVPAAMDRRWVAPGMPSCFIGTAPVDCG